jgi:hypothetical protein
VAAGTTTEETGGRGVNDAEAIALFLRAQNVLLVVGDRLQAGRLDWKDFETLTKLCLHVQNIADAGNTVERMALGRLACCTASLLTTAVVDGPENGEIVSAWLSARFEHAALSKQPPPKGRLN